MKVKRRHHTPAELLAEIYVSYVERYVAAQKRLRRE